MTGAQEDAEQSLIDQHKTTYEDLGDITISYSTIRLRKIDHL